jgi:hypothetical protein
MYKLDFMHTKKTITALPSVLLTCIELYVETGSWAVSNYCCNVSWDSRHGHYGKEFGARTESYLTFELQIDNCGHSYTFGNNGRVHGCVCCAHQ